MVVGQSFEIGCVADEHAMMSGEMFFELCGSSLANCAEHKVSRGVHHLYSVHLVQQRTQPLSLTQIGLTVGHVDLTMGQKPDTGLQCQRTDCPRAEKTFQNGDNVGRSDDETKPQAGNGITLRQRADLNHLGKGKQFLRRHHRLEGVVLVRQVNHQPGMPLSQLLHAGTVGDPTCGIIGITQPAHMGIISVSIAVDVAGISIFTEGGMENLVGLMAESPQRGSGVIDGLSGAIGHHHVLLIHLILPGKLTFQLLRRGSRIRGDGIHPPVHEAVKFRQISMAVDVGTKIHADVSIAESVITVSFNHLHSIFDKLYSCRYVPAHGQPDGRIAAL